MAGVITQIEMMKFAGMDKAVFPAGTIVTPSAKDWAKDHKIEIIVGENAGDAVCSSNVGAYDIGKAEILNCTIKAVLGNMNKAGGLMKKDELVEAVLACLKRLGCKINN